MLKREAVGPMLNNLLDSLLGKGNSSSGSFAEVKDSRAMMNVKNGCRKGLNLRSYSCLQVCLCNMRGCVSSEFCPLA